ncbi:hydroxymethylglutaryl-CoA reductase [Patescibacteria group bacterium]|nr:hydroxymethylglutaryl-CoA reductase [Patescibacteria group bacterium]
MKKKEKSLAKMGLVERRGWLEKKTGVSLRAIKKMVFTPAEVEGRHCENLVGATSLPLGVAGPLPIRFRSKQKDFYLPLATTEGALVASVNRGAKAICLSGGVVVQTELVGVTRAPVFAVDSLQEGRHLVDWLVKNHSLVAKTACQGEKHLHLLDLQTWQLGRKVFVRLVFNSDEAMGMNMASFAARRVVELVETRTEARCLAVSGNLCVDKKPAWLSSVLGRGRRVWVEAELSSKVVGEVLKTTSQALVQTAQAKLVAGGMLSGSLGFNAQAANIVAALFLATGQDPAHVVEGSLAVTEVELTKLGGVRVSVYLPAVMCGTVGGGTKLPTQQEALSLVGLGKGKKGEADWLAAILGGAVLAGEVSLLAALSAGQLCSAHHKLGQGGRK